MRRPSVRASAALHRCRSDRIAAVRESAKEALAVLTDMQARINAGFICAQSPMLSCYTCHDACNLARMFVSVPACMHASFGRAFGSALCPASTQPAALRQDYERGAGAHMDWRAFVATRSAARAAQHAAQGAGGRGAGKTLTLALHRPPRRARASPDIRRARRSAQALDRANTLAPALASAASSDRSSSADIASGQGQNPINTVPHGAAQPPPSTRRRASEGADSGPVARRAQDGNAAANPTQHANPDIGRRRCTWELAGAAYAQGFCSRNAGGRAGEEHAGAADSSEAAGQSRVASESDSDSGTVGLSNACQDSLSGSVRAGGALEAQVRR